MSDQARLDPAQAGPVPHGRWPAFRVAAYRWYWVGGLGSDIGNWAQSTTVPFVVLMMTHQAVWVGIATATALLAQVVTMLPGGRLADRVDRVKLLVAANIVMLALALLLAVVVAVGHAGVWEIVAITGVMSVVFGLQHPSWQSSPTELVPAAVAASAAHLTVTKFQAARALGPMLAGALIAGPGVAWAFWFNAMSFAGAIGALLRIARTRQRPLAGRSRGTFATSGSFASGLQVRGVLLGITLTATVAMIGLPIVQLSTLLAARTYRVGPGAYGLLVSAFGWGSLLSAVVVSFFHRGHARRRTTWYGFMLPGGAMLTVGIVPHYAVGVVAMAGVGISFAVITTSCPCGNSTAGTSRITRTGGGAVPDGIARWIWSRRAGSSLVCRSAFGWQCFIGGRGDRPGRGSRTGGATRMVHAARRNTDEVARIGAAGCRPYPFRYRSMARR